MHVNVCRGVNPENADYRYFLRSLPMDLQSVFNKSENKAVAIIVTVAVLLHIVFIWLIRAI